MAVTLKGNEQVFVRGQSTAGVSAAGDEPTTTAAIANLAGSMVTTAIGDGVTDNTAAIASDLATLFANYPNGAVLLFPRGTYVASQITIKRQQILRSSDGPQACTLFQKANSNCDFIVSENFAALTGTGLNYGNGGTFNNVKTDTRVPSWFGIWDMHINGNASNQGAGNWRGIAWYGNAQLMLGHNLIENCKQDNIYTEASGSYAYSATDWLSEEEGFFDHVISRNAGRYGWLNRGPHDSVIVDYIAPENTSTGYRSETSTSFISGGSGLPLYVGSAHIHTIHTYAETDGTGQYYGATSTVLEGYTDFDNCTLAATQTTIDKLYQIQGGVLGLPMLSVVSGATYCQIGLHNMDFRSAATNYIGCSILAGGGPFSIADAQAAAVPGLSQLTLYKIRSNFCSINGLFANADGAGSIGVDLQAAYCRITGMMFNCQTAVQYGGGNNNFVQLEIFKGSGVSTLVGTPDPTDTWLLTGDQGFDNQFPGLSINSANYNNSGQYVWNLGSSITGYFVPGFQTQATFKGAEANDLDSFQAVSNGFSITLGLSQSYLTLVSSSVITTGTVTMCSQPVPGQKIFIGTTQAITNLTVVGNSGQTMANPVTTLAAGGCVGWKYRPADTKWYRIQ